MVEFPKKLKAQLLTMKGMIGALILGVVMFMAVALYVNKFELTGELNILAKIALGKALFLIPLGMVVTKLLLKRRMPDSIESLGVVLQTSLLVGCVIIEGAAMFNIVAYLIGKNGLSLLMALLCTIAMLFMFPTKAKVEKMIIKISKR